MEASDTVRYEIKWGKKKQSGELNVYPFTSKVQVTGYVALYEISRGNVIFRQF